jgi:excisionase family DNA binding protein
MIELLNTRDVARMYQVTSATVLNWIRSGKLRAYTTPGGHYRVAREDLDTFSRLYGPPPNAGTSPLGLRVLLVACDGSLADRVRSAIRFRWPEAQVEHAATEFEVGWWLARLRPSHILVHPISTPPVLMDHCRQLTSQNGARRLRLCTLPDSPEEGLGTWIEQSFGS